MGEAADLMLNRESSRAASERPRWPGILLRCAIGLALLVLALRGVNLASMRAALARLNPTWILVAAATVLIGIGVKLWRWLLLLRPVCPEVSPLKALGALLLGQAANIVLPLRGGEIVRVLAIAPVGDGRLGAVVAGVAGEKALDLIALALLTAATLPILPQEILPTDWPWMLVLGLVILVLTILGIVWAERIWGRLRAPIASLLRRVRSPILEWGDNLVDGLARLRSAPGMWKVFLLTLLSWSVMLSTNLVLLDALGVGASLQTGLLVLILVHVALAPRVMPGDVGPFYFSARLGLEAFGAGASQATAFAILLHAIVTLPPLIGAGLYLLARRSGGVYAIQKEA